MDNFLEINISNELLPLIFGSLDSNVKIIEDTFQVKILERDNKIKIIGDNDKIKNTEKLINMLISKSKNGNIISEVDLNYCINMIKNDDFNKINDLDNNIIAKTYLGKPIKPKTLMQEKYIQSIKNNIITFGIGPAGTGKTFLAICMAINAFKNNEVQKLILTRPAIEAGEKLGFLPGDLQSKIDPYLRPLYDALYTLLGVDSFNSNIEKGLIEVAPLAYMRGRTLDNAFIILDESQNTTIPQMKMFLTRIGFNSKVVITGDDTQKDLPKNITSGLDHAVKILNKIDGINVIKLSSKDVVRHIIVQKIVEAYAKSEKKNNT